MFQQNICHSPSQRLGTARATSSTAVPTFSIHFCCFCFPDKLPISLLLTYTTKKTAISDGIFGRIRFCLNFSDGFGTVLTERKFRPKSVPKSCEIFFTCSNRVFSHEFRTNFLKKNKSVPKPCETLGRISHGIEGFYLIFINREKISYVPPVLLKFPSLLLLSLSLSHSF